jgi:glycosyltransferase involved in cell wall biosynthesis
MKYLVEVFYKVGWDVLILSPKDESSLKIFQEFNITSIKLKKYFNLEMHFSNDLSSFSLRGIKRNIYMLFYFIYGFIYAVNKLSKLKPDIVYINEYVLSQFSAASKILNIPVVTHIRSPFLKGTFGIRKYLFSKLLLKCNDYLFAITEQEALQIGKRTDKQIEKVKVIYEFLDENDFATQDDINKLKKNLSIPENLTVLLMLGGIEEFKGTYETIQAFSKVFELNHDVYLIIAGAMNNNPKYNSKCLKIIEKKKLSNNIKIIGFTSRAHDLISCADIVLSPSIRSHFSRPTIEAWSQQKPVISSDIDHSKEIIQNGKDGLLYKYNQPEELKEKIIYLLNHPEIRKTLGENGGIKARSLFRSDKNVNRIVNYCTLLL